MPFDNILSASTSRSSAPSDNPFTDDEFVIEVGVPLQDVPRISTETTRRNGFRQSVAPDRGTRIIEDIRNGKSVAELFGLLQASLLASTD
jgi:hypothetical protein